MEVAIKKTKGNNVNENVNVKEKETIWECTTFCYYHVMPLKFYKCKLNFVAQKYVDQPRLMRLYYKSIENACTSRSLLYGLLRSGAFGYSGPLQSSDRDRK